MKRIVVDTNVLVSGLLLDGKPGELVKLWKKRRVVPLCSKEIVKEYLRVLAYPKFQLSESEIDFLLTHEILPYFEVLTVKPGKFFVTLDPSDDKFIWCAIEGRADVIVSGDEHLLNLSPSPAPVTTVTLFMEAS
ncbi:MAG: putative toxin-antitoxin system toxin component, PIN family [Deltaproteobacteria bacterium]|nr:putative toxin-antitoxin system toxin component, PIN family [Deltaproteobacteria bacterium]